jgi:hypothetical protein
VGGQEGHGYHSAARRSGNLGLRDQAEELIVLIADRSSRLASPGGKIFFPPAFLIDPRPGVSDSLSLAPRHSDTMRETA